GTYRGFFEVSTVMYFEERKRFPEEFISARIPRSQQSPRGLKPSTTYHSPSIHPLRAKIFQFH
ncbi:hypothetical protein, partial [uncultured Clostridium sp.]|uniref:hypothetical protein n=1 Tax=uncultured Clostridium sp. TaxID=59620 RepID=UPI0025CFD3B9